MERTQLNILDGTVIGRNMQRHRHQEFIRFLNTIEGKRCSQATALRFGCR